MWSTPTQPTGTDLINLNVWDHGSRGREPLGDDDCVFPVGREVHVVGIVDRDDRPGFPVLGSIGVRLLLRSFVTYRVFKSHAGTTCWGTRQPEMVDHRGGRGIDDVDRVALRVRHIDPRRIVRTTVVSMFGRSCA